MRTVFGAALRLSGMAPTGDLNEIVAAMLDQVVNGFEKEPLMNEDLVRIGKAVLASAS
jgi:hypothetical protein